MCWRKMRQRVFALTDYFSQPPALTNLTKSLNFVVSPLGSPQSALWRNTTPCEFRHSLLCQRLTLWQILHYHPQFVCPRFAVKRLSALPSMGAMKTNSCLNIYVIAVKRGDKPASRSYHSRYDVGPGSDSGLRLVTVIPGDLFSGDRELVYPALETVYPEGSVLTVPHRQNHWMAAINGALRVQENFLNLGTEAPGVQN
jgi:hypothetical protein